MMSGGHGGDIVGAFSLRFRRCCALRFDFCGFLTPAETKQAESWTKLTVPIVGAFLCFVSYAEISHLKHSDEHPFVKPLYPYLRRNDKVGTSGRFGSPPCCSLAMLLACTQPFCWENKECSFFQVECHRAKRAGGKADH